MSVNVQKDGKLVPIAGNSSGGTSPEVEAKLAELESLINQTKALRADLETYGMVKLTDSSAVTDSTGLALPATEKNASIEGTLANGIEKVKKISQGKSSFSNGEVTFYIDKNAEPGTGIPNDNGHPYNDVIETKDLWNNYKTLNFYLYPHENETVSYNVKNKGFVNNIVNFYSGDNNINKVTLNFGENYFYDCPKITFYGITVNVETFSRIFGGNTLLVFGGYGSTKIVLNDDMFNISNGVSRFANSVINIIEGRIIINAAVTGKTVINEEEVYEKTTGTLCRWDSELYDNLWWKRGSSVITPKKIENTDTYIL